MNIDIQKASLEEKFLLRNLMELCQHDYSEFNGEDVSEYGLFGYRYLDHYWTEPGRHPFLVRGDGKLAGFVLVRRLDELPTHSIAEFFILRKYRGRGLGQIVAHRIFDLFAGKWQVGQEASNLPAQAFWKKVIARYTNNAYQEQETEGGPLQEFYTRDSQEKEMDENVQRDLALACVRLAQQVAEADEVMERIGPSRKSKARKEALQALLNVGDQRPLSLDHVREVLWQLYESSPAQSNTRQRVMQMLLDLAKRRDLPFGDAVETALTLYLMAPKGSEEKQQAIQMLLTQAQWPGITMKQSVEAVLALCYASPLRSKERQQGIQVLLELAQRPDLSVEDALVLLTLDSDMLMLIASTPAWVKRQQASRHQLLLALEEHPGLTSEQTVHIRNLTTDGKL